MTTTAEFLGFDADGDKVWQDTKSGLVTFNPTQQGAEWAFACGGGRVLDQYERRFGPITKEKQ